MRLAGQPVMSVPPSSTRPRSGDIMPEIRLTAVVLPAPFGPIRAHTWPAGTEKDAPRTAWTPPNPLCSSVQDSAASAVARPPSAAGARAPALPVSCAAAPVSGAPRARASFAPAPPAWISRIACLLAAARRRCGQGGPAPVHGAKQPAEARPAFRHEPLRAEPERDDEQRANDHVVDLQDERGVAADLRQELRKLDEEHRDRQRADDGAGVAADPADDDRGEDDERLRCGPGA